MHKFTNLTGTARQGWEKMTPANFGISRQNMDSAGPNNTNNNNTMPGPPAPMKRPLPQTASMSPGTSTDSVVNLSFNIPFSSNLAGPDVDDILHASPGALERWVHPDGAAERPPTHRLPVHVNNVETLRKLCKEITESVKPRQLEATVTSSEPKPLSALQHRPLKGSVTNVCLSGDAETVHLARGQILTQTPVALKSAIVDIDNHLVIDSASDAVKSNVLEHLDILSSFTGTDVFLLGPRPVDGDTTGSVFNGISELGLEQRLRVAIYGDMESVDHAKTRVLIMVDQILKRTVDAMRLELSMHNLICGRSRKNIKIIESETNTAIYLPPPFPRLYGYTPPGAHRRGNDEVFITGDSMESITLAKKKLKDLVMNTKIVAKEVLVTTSKTDSLVLDRLDKIRKITESNGTWIRFPQLGQRGRVYVQGTDVLHVERTVRELMVLAGQFYSASWWILLPDAGSGNGVRAPSSSDIRTMLSDICTNSGADVTFEKLAFSITGSDDAVKAAMNIIHLIPFVKRSQYQMRVKIELANEHKEFVSGKKNGKINKIMGQSNVQIIFDGFNEYNFYIDVCGSQYSATKNGLDLVEQEMPASISFHVPDQYHKRIIGIGGQHIQRIMKKYSVFVKFSNAMDRGRIAREDDDIKVDNVICRTPARNAQNLDLVKQEIMDMVEKVDAEFVSETVVINRLYHRELIARMNELEELEKKWNCKISFPGTEMASDVVTISGPEYQVPQAVDEFLGMVPESHEIVLPSSDELQRFLESQDFHEGTLEKLKSQHEVDLHLNNTKESEAGTPPTTKTFLLTYTRNNAGGLKDAIDFLISRLVANGIDATTIKGAITRPKSDSFEDNLPFFESKLLQHAPAPIATDSPTRSSFGASNGNGNGNGNGGVTGDDASDRSIFDKLRKPGSMASISSFLDRRKNQSRSPGSFFQNGSSNGSKASLISIESQSSFSRQPWNDSAVNLPEDHDYLSHNNRPPSRHLDYSTNTKSPFAPLTSVHSHGTPATSGVGVVGAPAASASAPAVPGDTTPKYDRRGSIDSGRPSTSHSASGYPGPIGPPR
ncbi:MAG: hypothetical protein M4579_003539 [Chaenotheca gracillima]|nr:MAG: hypothetical protein M4579_003539 [Chaenotheca gracillima]